MHPPPTWPKLYKFEDKTKKTEGLKMLKKEGISKIIL
jgi:hypothetical protein